MSTNPMPMPDEQEPEQDSADENAPIGTQATGYAGPDQGPFQCGNCEHFDGKGACDHPKVVADPEVKGQVEAEGCCNLFRPEESDQGKNPDELRAAIQDSSNPFAKATGNWAS